MSKIALLSVPLRGLTDGAISQVEVVPYTGDDVNSRVLDIGVAADLVLIFAADSRAASIHHLGLAYALGSVYGVFGNNGVTVDSVEHTANAAADSQFQGFGAGTTIVLGSTGTKNIGTNVNGRLYCVLAFKFA